MKRTLVILIAAIMLVALLPTLAMAAPTYETIPVTGFNEDLIAENTDGASASTSTSTTFDLPGAFGGNNVFYSESFVGPTGPAPHGLPDSGIINSTDTAGLAYNLQGYNTNNALHLIDNTPMTLTLTDPAAYNRIYLLATSSEGGSAFSVQVNFSDGTNMTSSFSVPDWCVYSGSPAIAINNIDRVIRDNSGGETDGEFFSDMGTYISNTPYLFDCSFPLTGNESKLITSLTITKTGGAANSRTGIFAVSGDAYEAPVISYTVTFDSQGATTPASPAAKTVISGNTVDALPTDPVKTGYTFGGWFTEINGGGTQFTASTVVTSDITVYAKWTQSGQVPNPQTGDSGADFMLYIYIVIGLVAVGLTSLILMRKAS